MGLHDGRDGISDEGSTAQVAEAPGAQRRLLEFYHFVSSEALTNDFLLFTGCETSRNILNTIQNAVHKMCYNSFEDPQRFRLLRAQVAKWVGAPVLLVPWRKAASGTKKV